MSDFLKNVLLMIGKCILYEGTQYCCVCKTEKYKSSAWDICKRYLPLELENIATVDNRKHLISFRNGSSILFLAASEPNRIKRGYRSKFPMFLEDYEICPKEVLDKVLSPYLTNRCSRY